MEIKISDIPLLLKSRVNQDQTEVVISSCCAIPAVPAATACCTPLNNPKENQGACCEQPEDGLACCNKA
ncbi:hypothetical protein [Flavihumibacter sp. UBA7668]|uniref:hypothetical protein n=1 Tax=Flavihumibacter sp. UBA7668 TaxID=1946542 RepID=UPI0025C6855D|nr:hypothetical protein [Flavihumibacter sp. UBA7668]